MKESKENEIRIWKEEIQGFEKEILEIESRSIQIGFDTLGYK